jgi:hypothetical protein
MIIVQTILNLKRLQLGGMNNSSISSYIFSFYNDEQKASFYADLANCVANGWLADPRDDAAYVSAGAEQFSVDLVNNRVTTTFLINNVDMVCPNLFDPPKVGVNPVKEYFDSHPEEGTYGVRVIDEQGNDRTSEYSYL